MMFIKSVSFMQIQDIRCMLYSLWVQATLYYLTGKQPKQVFWFFSNFAHRRNVKYTQNNVCKYPFKPVNKVILTIYSKWIIHRCRIFVKMEELHSHCCRVRPPHDFGKVHISVRSPETEPGRCRHLT